MCVRVGVCVSVRVRACVECVGGVNDLRLLENDALLWINATRQIRSHSITNVLPKHRGLPGNSDGVQV